MLAGTAILHNCKEDCYKAPEPTVFEFVNASGENLIQNGTLNSSGIVVQQDNGNGNMAGINIEIRDDRKVVLKNAGLYDGTRTYHVYLTTEPVKTFDFKISSIQRADGCDGFTINNVTVENITWSAENGYYRIVVD